ncbi:MAG: hypothetical protein C4293_13865 [Nitrospiraceae bacterium]
MNDLVCELDTSASKITLGDLLVFIDWMYQAETALEKGEPLPQRPDMESEKVKGWIGLIHKVEERYRRIEEKRVALEANLMAQEAQLNQLISQLHQNIASLYETMGREDKADQFRKKAETVHAG